MMFRTFFQRVNSYFVWLAYIFLIFLFTNAYSSLDLIKIYGLTWDILLTYGFLGFLMILESLAIVVFVAVLQYFLEKIIKVDLTSYIKLLLIFGLALAIVNLALMAFNRALFIFRT